MNFWLRNIIIGLVLLGLAFFFFSNQELFLSLDKQFLQPESEELVQASDLAENSSDSQIAKPIDVPKTQPKIKDKNAAAEGLSNFYASINADLDGRGPKIRNNIVFLPDPKGDLVKILEARRMVTRPLKANWKGIKADRPFRVGETIFQKLTEYANNDGLEIIWWLNRDFLVKSPFRIDDGIFSTVHKLAKSVEGHFQNGVNIYFCYQQRAIVLIDDNIDYLNEECTLLDKKTLKGR
ncbi:TcpQ domain-containing protein [Colwelliaceae bacterium 6471]